MANHKSTLKSIRSNETKRLRNKYVHKTMRSAIKELRGTTDKKAAAELYPKVIKLVDKLAQHKVIHKNKASNLKSKLAQHVNAL